MGDSSGDSMSDDDDDLDGEEGEGPLVVEIGSSSDEDDDGGSHLGSGSSSDIESSGGGAEPQLGQLLSSGRCPCRRCPPLLPAAVPIPGTARAWRSVPCHAAHRPSKSSGREPLPPAHTHTHTHTTTHYWRRH
jgi:hypothetical protein